MKFTKMHGCGNDYIYVNCFEEKIDDPGALALKLSDRHKGIGSDGLIMIKPSDCADFEMDIYNSDGSRAAMCGNGIRCVGKYVYDHGMTDKTTISVDTASGIKILELYPENGKVEKVRVNMGAPILTAAQIPVKAETEQVIDQIITAGGEDYRFTAVSMGNPHSVVFVEQDVREFPLEQVGPLFEHNVIFPDRVNAEFVRKIDDTTVEMRVWERGAGETMACGTGACAVAVASILNKKVTGNTVKVCLMGGDLEITWDREQNLVFMTGPATTVFDGEIIL